MLLSLKHIPKTMKKLFKICAVSLAILCLSSCAFKSTFSNNITETKVVLSENNFKVVGQAYGESSSTYIFGFGGISRKSLRNNAISAMSKNANLTGAQTLTNTTVHFNVAMWTPFYIKTTCTATANIVEFTK